MGRQPRQRPVSCHFCRVRKLRCSRDFPCSNCTSRGVPCREPQDPPRASAPAQRPIAKRTAVGAGEKEKETDILSRLERLEALLAQQNKQPAPESQSSSALPSIPEADAPPRPQQDSQLALPLNVQNLTDDALWLDRTCLGQKTSETVLGDKIVFRTCPIRMITQSSCYIFQNSSIPSGFLSVEPTKCVWLPTREETRTLVEKYTTGITYMHHIVHNPSLCNLVDEVYDALDQGTQVPLCSVVLLLAVCANVTYSWTQADNETAKLFTDAAEANAQAIIWLKGTMDVFDVAQRNVQVELESAQGLIIMSFVLLNIEGISTRARTYLFQAIAISRELGLHRLDHPLTTSTGHPKAFTGIRAEAARRVWWYLVGLDCMLARFPGPHEGTYLINPKHMAVRKPRNLNDEDLVDGDEPGKPLTESTSMSYFLQRIRLAELTRKFTDRMPLSSAAPETMTYDLVLELDAAIDQFIGEIPPFLAMEGEELAKLPPNDIRRSPAIIIQRHIMKLFVQGQRCRLHLPYLARGSIEPRYAHSRNVCLDAAQTILHAEHLLDKENVAFTSTRLRTTLVLHSVFLATIILILDFCLGTTAQEKEARRQQLVEAWKILDTAKEHSKPTARIQDLLKQVMKKHKVSICADEERNQLPVRSAVQETSLPLTPSSAAPISTGATPNDADPSSQAWDELGSMIDLDGMDWENLLWGLDAPLI
ncbi:hypothetical protein LRP88_07016 [Fusarium phalaenopsidis]